MLGMSGCTKGAPMVLNSLVIAPERPAVSYVGGGGLPLTATLARGSPAKAYRFCGPGLTKAVSILYCFISFDIFILSTLESMYHYYTN